MITLSKMVALLYRISCGPWRRGLVTFVRKWEKGEMQSLSLRSIYKKYHGIEVGLYSYGCFNHKHIDSNTLIGRYCSFASGVSILNTNHPLNHRALHPYFYNPSLGVVTEEAVCRRRIHIGHDVWVGRNAIITASVKSIGNGAVVGAGAVVTKDVPAYAIVAGNPARLIRYRFSPRTIACIESTRWWEKTIEGLRENVQEFAKVLE